ncbi:MAG: hypothetical protein GXO47_07465, partial [Chlorobi bacterium]|nr:hypothetical protein [Chlorobiota bacterium]
DVEAEQDGRIVNINTNMRFSAFLNFAQDWHYDFSNNFGLYTGFAFRNIGLIIDDYQYSDMNHLSYDKVKRRSYTLGMPLAFKFGNFDSNMYLFGGTEIELLFHYKEKYWINDTKYKSKEWFSNKTERWAPSFFAGIQFAGGNFIKFKYYTNDFLNHDYVGPVYDFTSLRKSSMWYISIGFRIKTKSTSDMMKKEFYETAMR